MKRHLIIFLFVILSLIIPRKLIVYAYDNSVVHQKINKNAVLQSSLRNVLIQLGYPNGIETKLKDINSNEKEVWEWFEEGGKAEDEPLSRTMNHFHDPTKAWNEAGLNDYCVILPVTGESSVLWAQKTTQIDGDTWSWQKAREYYYLGLTATTKEVREQNLANTFKTVGHIMHLVSDVSVPDMKFESKGLLQ